MNRVTHFEIYIAGPGVGQSFYLKGFSWKLSEFEGGPMEHWLVTTGDDKESGNSNRRQV